MPVERHDGMVDKLGRDLHIGDVIAVAESISNEMSLYLIKHFSNNGIFGWRMSSYSWRGNTIEDNLDNVLDRGKIFCESRYSINSWNHYYSLSSQCLKIDKKSLPITKSQFQRLYELLDINEYRPTGSFCL